MSAAEEAEAVLRRLAAAGADGRLDLAEGALAFAAWARPGARLAPYREHAAALAAAVARARAPTPGLAGRIGALNRVLFGEYRL